MASPDGERLQTFATVTTDASELLALIQDRMPVIIEKADWPVWLGEAEGDPAALLRSSLNGFSGSGRAIRRWATCGITARI
jgi:putative SOS response-associated peptidase YedK